MSNEVKVAIISAVSAVMVAVIGVYATQTRSAEKPRGDVVAPAPTPQPAGAETPSARTNFGGSYVLESYSLNGTLLPLAGSMTLTAAGAGGYSFSMAMRRTDIAGVQFWYRGTSQPVGDQWDVTTTSTNDPTVTSPLTIRNDVTIRSGTLTLTNALGQRVVWRRE